MQPIDFLDRGAVLAPGSECLVEGDLRLNYATVRKWTHRIAWALERQGVRSGDAVAVLSPNSAWGYLVILALLRAGCIWVPLNVRTNAKDWDAQMKRTSTRWLFAHPDYAHAATELAASCELRGWTLIAEDSGSSALQQWMQGVPDADFLTPPAEASKGRFRMTSSGGTTGAPKAIVQTQAGLAANVASFLAIASHPAPRYLMCNPMTHAAGVLGFPILALGGTIVFTRRPDVATLPETIARERITCLMLTPTSIYALLERHDLAQHDLSTLSHFMYGAAPMPPELLTRALAVFGPVMMQLYAQSEASTLLAAMLPSDYAHVLAQPGLEQRLKSVGRPTPFARISIMDDEGRMLPAGTPGEIVVRSAMVMEGYLGDDEATQATRAHGWHHTGDIGVLDSDGFLYVVDRKRDLIISGGFNIFPSEIEQLLLAQPGVKDCAVIGVKDPRWGEAVKAVIELADSATVDLAQLEAVCKERLGSVKTPKTFDVWAELPRSHLGKILKRSIREHYE